MNLTDNGSTGQRIGVKAAIAGISVIALIAVAFVVGRSSKSPEQAAATAAAPKSSIITATISEKVLAQTTVFRGDVGPTAAIGIGAPQLPSGSQPIVTSVEAHQGDKVGNGGVLASIAGRPIIVLQGAVPAFRTMQYGDTGVDVAQLQQSLLSLGYGIGSDSSGVFGKGTSRSVLWLYNHVGYTPQPGPSVATGSSQSTNAAATGSTTGGTQGTPTADTSSPTWSVNYGEIVFVPNLPATVSVDSLTVGQLVTSGSSASAQGATGQSGSSTQPIITLGAGGAEVTGQVSTLSAASLRKGMPAQLDDDATGGSWQGTVAKVTSASSTSNSGDAIPQATVVIVPNASSSIPTSEIGQNIRVTVTSARTKSKVFVVPIAAVFSHPDGRTYVRVTAGMIQRDVPVSVGLDSSGSVQITPIGHARLKSGEKVVIGSTSGVGSPGS